jgi:hypothetical protein
MPIAAVAIALLLPVLTAARKEPEFWLFFVSYKVPIFSSLISITISSFINTLILLS